jgi:hypothetical protein
MPFAFLAPLFLAAAAAIVIPIVVHLRRRETRDAIQFPSLMFLRRIPHRTTSRRRIHHWPLLLMRILALILIASAFARPLLKKDDPKRAASNTPAREIVIMIDKSYSMGVGDRFEQAKKIALDTIAALRADDRATIVAFDANARTLIDPTADKSTLRSLISELKVSDAGTRYAPAIKVAANVLDASPLQVRDALLISDMQRIGWDADPSAKLPAGVTLRTIAVTSPGAANLAIASLDVKRTVEAGRERVTPVARVVSRGDAAATNIRLSLELDGRPEQTRQFNIGADGAATIEFSAIPITGPIRAVVRLPDDAVPADNERNAILAPERAVRVLVQGSSASANLYAVRALALAKDPVFLVTERTGALAAADLKEKNVVVLNDVAVPAGAAGARLKELVENGGGLVVAVGEQASAVRHNDIAGALLPARATGIADQARTGGVPFGTFERSHPVFDVFRAPRSGDLLAARFYRHARLDELPRDSAVRATSDVLARFGDGGAALLERRVGAGRVVMFAAGLDNYWSDLPLQPVYLPMLHRMLLYAAGWKQASAAHIIGDAVAIDPGDYVVVSPRSRRITLSSQHPVLPLEERGFYEVRDASRAGTVVSTIASNVYVAESDLTPLNASELASSVQVAATGLRATRETPVATPVEREHRQSLWWYLMVLGFALLAVETVVSNRLSRRPIQKEAVI